MAQSDRDGEAVGQTKLGHKRCSECGNRILDLTGFETCNECGGDWL